MTTTLPEKDLLRVDEVAEYFSVSDSTIRLWIDHGHLRAVKLRGVVRVIRESVVDFLVVSKLDPLE